MIQESFAVGHFQACKYNTEIFCKLSVHETAVTPNNSDISKAQLENSARAGYITMFPLTIFLFIQYFDTCIYIALM